MDLQSNSSRKWLSLSLFQIQRLVLNLNNSPDLQLFAQLHNELEQD